MAIVPPISDRPVIYPNESLRTAPGLHAADFTPATWLPGRHLQTIWAPLFRKAKKLLLRRERVELPDGDFLDLDRLDPLQSDPKTPRLLVLHGLEGSSASTYARGLLAEARARDWHGIALNFRSCSGEMNRLPRSYHSGETGDLATVIAKLCAESPEAPLLIAGVSLGGNVLVKWLGEMGEQVPRQIRAAAAISVPFDLAACAQALDGPGFWARIYCKRFLATLMVKAREKAGRFPDALSEKNLKGISKLFDFDDRVTGPVHGFAGARDYYSRSSSNQFIGKVRVPLLLLSAEDDPFIPPEALPREQVRESRFVRLEISPKGGHVGFVSGSVSNPKAWAEERAVEFLAAFATQLLIDNSF